MRIALCVLVALGTVGCINDGGSPVAPTPTPPYQSQFNPQPTPRPPGSCADYGVIICPAR